MKRTYKIFTLFFLIGIILNFTGCSKTSTGNDDNQGSPKLSADELLSRGWSKFEQADYDSARYYFRTVLNEYPDRDDEANEGIGWSFLIQYKNQSAQSAEIDSALNYFMKATLRIDANAGRCIIYHARDDYNNAISRANSVLSENANYQFAHYPTVDAYILHWIIAHSAFQQGNYQLVIEQLSILSPGTQYDPNNPQQLLDAINSLWKPI